MPDQNTSIERGDAVAIITLSGEKGNALSLDMVHEITAAVRDCAADPAVRCMIITGGDGRFFSVGAHLPTIKSSLSNVMAEGGLLAEGLAMVDTIAECPTPIIAAVSGAALGGGCELALACHVRIASDTAQFGQPEINLGLIPGWGGCRRLPRIVGEGRALAWLLSGQPISAEEALHAGLVYQVVPSNKLLAEAHGLASVLASKPPVAVQAILRAVREAGARPERGRALEAEGFAEAAATDDAHEGVQAFLEKRAPRFTGK